MYSNIINMYRKLNTDIKYSETCVICQIFGS